MVFLENELLYGRSFEVPELDDFILPIGKARIVREGTDVTIVSYSIGVGLALEAAETLAEEGIEAEVIDLRTAAPARHGERSIASPEEDQPLRRRSRKAGRSARSATRSRRC